MRNNLRIGILFLIITFSSRSTLGSSGWEAIGPDSTGWTDVWMVNGKWTSPGAFYLSAPSDEGVAIYSSTTGWDYTLANDEGSLYTKPVFYWRVDFSPWEPDSIFIGMNLVITEGVPLYTKWHLPITYPPGHNSFSWSVGGDCWFSDLSMVFPPGTDSTVVAGVCGIYVSSNRGQVWSPVELDTLLSSVTLVGTDRPSSEILYKADGLFGYDERAVYRSTDGGLHWSLIFQPVPGMSPDWKPVSIVAQGDTIILGVRTGWAVNEPPKGIFRSLDGGQSWNHVYNDGRISGIACSNVSNGLIFAAGEEGVLVSANYGETWSAFNNNLPTTRVTGLIVSEFSDTVYVSTETHGVLKVWDYVVGVDEPDQQIPQEFSLHQNYPNPFNAISNFEFEIAKFAHVSLNIYDLLGQKVTTLVNDKLAPGTYRRQWDAKGHPSGVYFYRMSAGSFVQTKKLLLLR